MRLLDCSVTPFYGIIALFDRSINSEAEFNTGMELAVSDGHCIFVATRNDLEGPVQVEVLLDDAVVLDGYTKVFDGTLEFSGQVAVGSIIGNEIFDVPIVAGTYEVKVYAAPGARETASHLRFSLASFKM